MHKAIIHTIIVLVIGYFLGVYFPSLGNTVKSKL